MQTTTINAPVWSLANGVRRVGAMTNILKQGFMDMVNSIKADSFKLVSNAEGTQFLHILNAGTQEYFSVKRGAKAVSNKKGNDLIKDLIENYVIYTGVTENGVWFTFGPVGEMEGPIAEITLAELTAAGVKAKVG
jgi:hypothetical protein